jgi:hypothetical protein
MSLTAEQCRALAMLTSAGLDGASQTLLMAHGFCVSMIVGLVNNGLATLTHEKVWAGSRLIEVDKVRITAAGREALITEGSVSYPSSMAPICQCSSRPGSSWRSTSRPQKRLGSPRRRSLSPGEVIE